MKTVSLREQTAFSARVSRKSRLLSQARELFACSRNKSISCLSMSHRDVPSSTKRFHTVGFILLWLSIFVSMFAMKMLAKAIYQVPIRARFNVANMPKAA